MIYPFSGNNFNNEEDFELINNAVSGSKNTLGHLLIKYSFFLKFMGYNIYSAELLK